MGVARMGMVWRGMDFLSSHPWLGRSGLGVARQGEAWLRFLISHTSRGMLRRGVAGQGSARIL